MRGIRTFATAAIGMLLSGTGSAAAQVAPIVCETADNATLSDVALREGPFRRMRGVLRYTGIVEGQPRFGFAVSDGSGRKIIFAFNHGAPALAGEVTPSMFLLTRIREFRDGKLTGESGTGIQGGSEIEFELASGPDGKARLSVRQPGGKDYDTVTLVTPAIRRGALLFSCAGGRFELGDLTIE